MITIKTLPAILLCFSLGMADISGIVINSVGAPVPGAVVQLENGGQSTTTGSDGSFTLVVGTANLPGKNKRPSAHNQSVTIRNGLLYVNSAEKSAVEIRTFGLDGTTLSTGRYTLNPGSQTIALQPRSTGVYMYRVKAGETEYVLRGTAIGRILFERSITSRNSPSQPPAKQAMSKAVINDILMATKTGYLNYRMEIGNSDARGIEIKMVACAGMVTDADGNVYQTVIIGNQEWMAENLRVTKYNDGSAIVLDTSAASWESVGLPKYCFYNNTTDPASIRKYGALYNWYVVDNANPKKIAPKGWHVPSDGEWLILQNYLIANGFNWDGIMTGNKFAKALAAKTDWRHYITVAGSIGNDLTKNNSSGFSALPGGMRGTYGIFSGQSGGGSMTNSGFWWGATEAIAGSIARSYLLGSCNVDLGRINYNETWGFSVRLVRD